jgi:hypothetical protein
VNDSSGLEFIQENQRAWGLLGEQRIHASLLARRLIGPRNNTAEVVASAHTRLAKGAMTCEPFLAGGFLSISRIGAALRKQGLFD